GSAEKNTPRKHRRVEADFGTRDMAWSSISMHGLQLHNFGCGMRQSCLRQYYASVAAGGGAQLQLFEPRLATVWHDGGADRTVITAAPRRVLATPAYQQTSTILPLAPGSRISLCARAASATGNSLPTMGRSVPFSSSAMSLAWMSASSAGVMS